VDARRDLRAHPHRPAATGRPAVVAYGAMWTDVPCGAQGSILATEWTRAARGGLAWVTRVACVVGSTLTTMTR